ncbi:PAS domain S-box protein [Flavobacterium sp. UBA7663]|uniref:PAS domain S-box protein n=1 Tax=Flavobacterium sp. UBA7663 TaxID=1946557 RepID=UPI0025BB7FF4|nr:PAS domain S-box protein [Flavobacterium sp. UBA7663]
MSQELVNSNLFNLNPLPSWIYDYQTLQILDVNIAAIEHYGYSREEFLKLTIKDIRPSQEIENLINALATIKNQNGNIYFGIFTHQKKNGSLIQMEINGHKLDFNNRKCILIVCQDITKRIEQEEQIYQSKQRFKALVQEGGDMISIIDTNGRYSYTSPTTTAILGITPEEFQGNTIFDFIHPDDIEKATSYIQRITTEKKIIVEPFRFKDGKNEWRWIETVLTNMLDNPAVKGIVANSRDITKQKKEEHQLKLLSSVITNTKDSVVITEIEPFDQSGPKIIYVNNAFTEMTGYMASETIGKTTKFLQGPNTDKNELKKLNNALMKWESCEITILNYKKNGEEFWNNFTVSPVADEKGTYTHWIAIQRDVTEQKNKELEKELLSKISLNFSTEKDLTSTSNLLCQTIAEFGYFDFVELWLPNIEKTQLQLIAKKSNSSNATNSYKSTNTFKTCELDRGLQGAVWSERKILIWEDICDKDDFELIVGSEKSKIKNTAGIPLIFNNQMVGVLLVTTQNGINALNKYYKLFEHFEQFIGSEINRKKLENDLRRLYDTIPDILCITDFHGRFLKINKGGCEMLEYTEEEILYQPFDVFLHPEDKKISKNELVNITKGQITFSFENRYITKSGKVIWLSWTSTSSEDEGLIYATAKNITEEKKLREINRQTRKLAKVGGWDYDLLENKLFWSEEVHQLHETNPNTFIPDISKAIEFYKEEHKEHVTELINNSIANGTYLDYEAIIITKNKKERWIRVIANPEYIEEKCIKFTGSFQDITDRKEAEARLQNLSDNIPGVVYQYLIYPDNREEIRNVSKGAEKIWGYSAEEITNNINLAWSQTKAGGDMELVKQSIIDSITNKTNWSARFRTLTPNGEKRVLQGFGKPEFSIDGTILFNSILLDITQETKNEELLAQTTKIAKIGSWELDRIENKMYWSDILYELHEADPISFKPDLNSGINFYRDDFKEMVTKNVTKSIETGVPFEFEAVIVTAKNNERWIRSLGNAEMVNGECTRLYGSFQDINDQKIVEIQKNSLQNTLENSLNEIYIFDSNTFQFLYVNKGALINIGYTAEEIKKLTPIDIKPDYTIAAFEELVAPLMNNEKEKLIFFTNHKRKDGSLYPVEVHLQLVPENTQKRFLAVILDITERKKTEKEIRDSEEKRRLIMSGALDAIICIDTNESITFWNHKAEIIFGWKETEALGQQLSELIVPEPYRKYHREGMKHYLKTGEGRALNVLLELSAIKRNGDEFPIELTVIPINQGEDLFFCAFIRDITERKKSEARILQANERFEIVTQATNDAIWDWNIKEKIFFRSQNIKKFFGEDTPSNLNENQFWNNKFHPDDVEKTKKSLSNALENPLVNRWEAEYRIFNESEKIVYVIDRGIIIRDNKGKATRMIGAMTNITEQKNHEAQLVALNESLQSYAKELERSNEELEQFAFITSHDLQEPLRMISSFMDQLKRKYEDKLDDKALQYIDFATNGSKRMKQIILDLLDYSRAGRPTDLIEMVDVNEIISDFKLLRGKIISEKSATISHEKIPNILTYKTGITQVFHSLLDNAIKYSKKEEAPNIIISCKEEENKWVFTVKDNGIGIDSKFYNKIFVIFQRLHNREEYEGTGIGLSIVKRHIDYLGGKIWVESEINIGSTFYFEIPKNK